MIPAFERAYGFRPARADVLDSTDQRLLVKVVDGAGRVFALKSRPSWITASDFEEVLGLQEQAIAHGARIPHVVRTLDGGATWRWEERDLSLHAWVEGTPLRWSASHSKALGSAVGAFARTTAAMTVDPASAWTFPAGRERWLPDTPGPLRTVCRFIEAADVPPGTFAAIDEIAQRAQGSVDARALPAGFIHGDVSPLNTVQRSGRATLIDLDAMRWGFRLFDAVQGVATVAGLDPGPRGPIVRPTWDLDRARAFLTAWSREARPAAAELAAFPSLLQLALIRVVVGELDLDDPALPTRWDARSSVEALLALLRTSVPPWPT